MFLRFFSNWEQEGDAQFKSNSHASNINEAKDLEYRKTSSREGGRNVDPSLQGGIAGTFCARVEEGAQAGVLWEHCCQERCKDSVERK